MFSYMFGLDGCNATNVDLCLLQRVNTMKRVRCKHYPLCRARYFMTDAHEKHHLAFRCRPEYLVREERRACRNGDMEHNRQISETVREILADEANRERIRYALAKIIEVEQERREYLEQQMMSVMAQIWSGVDPPEEEPEPSAQRRALRLKRLRTWARGPCA